MARKSLRQVYFNRRMAVILGLGFASGVPLSLTATTMQGWLTDSHVDKVTIGLLAWVTLPYSFKFVWSPLMDRFSLPGLTWLGRRRAWLLATQMLLILCIAGMGLTAPSASIWAFGFMAALVAFTSASQDIVSDAYRTDVLPPEELAAGAGLYVNGYRFGIILSGGGALMLAGHLPWRLVYFLMAAALAPGILATLLAPNVDAQTKPPESLARTLVDPFREFLGLRVGGLLVLAFILLFKVPEMMATWQITPYLLGAAKFTKAQVGFFQGTLGVAIMLIGALGGGAIVARWGLIRALWVMGILGACSNAGYMFLSWFGNRSAVVFSFHAAGRELVATQGLLALVGVVSVENFCYGLVTSGFVAFLMSQCNRRYSATQYALLSSMMGLSGVIFRSPTGYLVEHLGWTWFFAITILAGVPGMLLLLWIRQPQTREA